MYNSFATKKDSPLTEIISEGLRKVKALNRNLELIQEKWLKPCQGPTLSAYAFSLEYAGGLVISVSIFTLIAIVLLLIESIYCYLRGMNIFVINPEE